MPDIAPLSGGQTTKLCPYQLFTVASSIATGTYCIKEACQLWVKPADEVAWPNDPFSTVTGTDDPTGLITNDEGGRCGAQVSDHSEHLFKLVHHLHRHHQHPKGHTSCKTIPLNCGSTFFGFALPRSFQLANEFQSNEDYDGNGKIYGKDFEIEIDENTPTILTALTTNPLRTSSKNKVKWSDFIRNKFPPKVRSMYPNTFSVNGGMRVRIFGAFFSGNLNDFTITLSTEYNPDLPESDTNQNISVDLTDINIIDINKLYATIPAFSGVPGTVMNMTITNSGDTFYEEGEEFYNPFINTGGSTIITRQSQYVSDDDNEEVKQNILEEECSDDPTRC